MVSDKELKLNQKQLLIKKININVKLNYIFIGFRLAQSL